MHKAQVVRFVITNKYIFQENTLTLFHKSFIKYVYPTKNYFNDMFEIPLKRAQSFNCV